MANVKCPKCQNLISGVQPGQLVKCPKCGYTMKLAGSTSTQTSSANSFSGNSNLNSAKNYNEANDFRLNLP